MPTFEEMTEVFKIAKLLKDKSNTSKEAKEKLNQLVSIVNAYAITILGEITKDGDVSEEQIQKVFKTLERR